MTRVLLSAMLLLVCLTARAQKFTLADSLRGTLSPLRSCFDVHFYELDIAFDLDKHSISGSNAIHFTATTAFDRFQIDLFENLTIDSIIFNGRILSYDRKYNAVFVTFPQSIASGSKEKMLVYYHGTPTEAKSPPWDGGFVWKTDSNGKPHVGVACEGLGASVWWPNKDHLSDEPDSMRMHYSIPNGLMCVGNGQLLSRKLHREHTRWSWQVSNPINNYNVTFNIGDYVHFTDHYVNASDSLLLNFYVLRHNLEKAKAQFKQVQPMLAIYEDAFGPYPFKEDGYALVETTYSGMEHQSAIAYGNRYMKGYLGRYPSDMDFDYIMVHETGHEWWGNSVSANDLADMWVHESFCTYAESVFVEGKYGHAKMMEYLKYQKAFITNKSPMRGIYGVNQEGNTTDMYYKGSWMLHTLRSVVNNDAVFKAMLKAVANEFRHRNVDGATIIQFMSSYLKRDLKPFFEQYIGHASPPVLEYAIKGNKLNVRWKADVAGFAMPMEVNTGLGAPVRANVKTNEWTKLRIADQMLENTLFAEDRFLFLLKKVTMEKKKKGAVH